MSSDIALYACKVLFHLFSLCWAFSPHLCCLCFWIIFLQELFQNILNVCGKNAGHFILNLCFAFSLIWIRLLLLMERMEGSPFDMIYGMVSLPTLLGIMFLYFKIRRLR